MNDELHYLVSWRKRQQASWRDGQPLWIESFLEYHSDLCLQDELLLDLIYSEVCAREAAGNSVAGAEYLERFPHLAVSLSRLFEVHEYIQTVAHSQA